MRYRLLVSALCKLHFYWWARELSRYSDWLRAGQSWDHIPVGRDFPPVQTGPGAHRASCTMVTGSFPEVEYGRGVLLTTHSLLVPWSWKSRAIPLPTLWITTGPVTGSLYTHVVLLPDRALIEGLLTFKRRIKSHLPSAGIIRSSPYSPRFQDKG